jgi:hypothetical protein
MHKNRNPNQHRIKTEVTTIDIKHPEYANGNKMTHKTEVTTINIKHPEYTNSNKMTHDVSDGFVVCVRACACPGLLFYGWFFGFFLGGFISWSYNFWFIGCQTMNKVQKYTLTNSLILLDFCDGIF